MSVTAPQPGRRSDRCPSDQPGTECDCAASRGHRRARRARCHRSARAGRQLPPAGTRDVGRRSPRQRARPGRDPRGRRSALPEAAGRRARGDGDDLRRARDRHRRPLRLLPLARQRLGRPLLGAARARRGRRPAGERAGDAVEGAPPAREPQAPLGAALAHRADRRRECGRAPVARRLPGRRRLRLHARRAHPVHARPRRPAGAGRRGHERLARAERLVRPVEEPRSRRRLPGRDPCRGGPDARPARVRRPAPRAARPGRQRGRRRPLGRRPRPARRRRLPGGPPRRRPRPHRRDRLLDRRREPARGRSRSRPRSRRSSPRAPASAWARWTPPASTGC